jgi:hypothetical protein
MIHSMIDCIVDDDEHSLADSVREFLYFAPLADPYL